MKIGIFFVAKWLLNYDVFLQLHIYTANVELRYPIKYRRTISHDEMVSKANLGGLRLRWLLVFAFFLSFLVAVISACASPTSTTTPASDQDKAPPGVTTEERPSETQVVIDTSDGKLLFVSKACVGCHTVQGIPEAQGKVGPELTHWAGNALIADTLPNTDENLRKWLKDPPAVKPATMMPNQDLTDREIDALIAFLRTLK